MTLSLHHICYTTWLPVSNVQCWLMYIKADGCMQDIVCWHRWQWETKRYLGAWRQVRLAPVILLVQTTTRPPPAATSSVKLLIYCFSFSDFSLCCLVRLHSYPKMLLWSEGNKLKTKSIRTKISFTSEVIGITGLTLFTKGDFGGVFIFSLPKKQRNVFFLIVQPYFVKTAVI